MAKPDSSFKYRVGQRVIHVPPGDQPQRFEVVSQVLQATPSGPQRLYYLRRAEQSAQGSSTANQTLCLFEDNVAPLDDGR